MKKLLMLFALSYLSSSGAQTPTPLNPNLIYSRVQEISRLAPVKPHENARDIEMAPATARTLQLSSKAQRILQGGNNIALVLVEDGKLVFEGYARGGNESRQFVSFSMGKSLTSLAVGEALCSGHLRSIEDLAVQYNSSIPRNAFGTSSIKQLLTMSSGAMSGNHPGFPGMPYPNATHEVLTQQVSTVDLLKRYGERESVFGGGAKPGTRFSYNNLDTDALEFVVSGATNQPFARWFEIVSHRVV